MVSKALQTIERAGRKAGIFAILGGVILIMLVGARMSGDASDETGKNIIGVSAFVAVSSFLFIIFRLIGGRRRAD